MRVDVDGHQWFEGQASCVLVGNVGTIIGGVTAFDDARPDDGWLEVGVVTAEGPVAVGAGASAAWPLSRSERSPFVQTTRGHEGRHPARPEDALRARRRRPQAAKRLKVAGRAGRDHRLRARGRNRREHRQRRSRDLGAQRRRRHRDAAEHRSPPAGRRRLPAAAGGRRLQPRPLAGLHDVARAGPGDHRRRRAGQPRSATATSATPSSAPSTTPCPGPPGDVLTAAVDQARDRGRLAAVPRPWCSGSSAPSSPPPRRWASSSGA